MGGGGGVGVSSAQGIGACVGVLSSPASAPPTKMPTQQTTTSASTPSPIHKQVLVLIALSFSTGWAHARHPQAARCSPYCCSSHHYRQASASSPKSCPVMDSSGQVAAARTRELWSCRALMRAGMASTASRHLSRSARRQLRGTEGTNVLGLLCHGEVPPGENARTGLLRGCRLGKT